MKNDLVPNIIKKLFQFREPLYNLRLNMSTYMTRKVRIAYHDLNTVIYLAP